MVRRLLWTLKQLTPRTYWTGYGVPLIDAEGRTGEPSEEHFVIWKMWLGHCYDVIDITTGQRSTAPNARAACYPLPGNRPVRGAR